MTVDFATKQDLEILKTDIFLELRKFLEPKIKQEYLTGAEVKELLKCSNGTLQNHRVNGRLPHVKVGGKIYYKYSDVEMLFKAN